MCNQRRSTRLANSQPDVQQENKAPKRPAPSSSSHKPAAKKARLENAYTLDAEALRMKLNVLNRKYIQKAFDYFDEKGAALLPGSRMCLGRGRPRMEKTTVSKITVTWEDDGKENGSMTRKETETHHVVQFIKMVQHVITHLSTDHPTVFSSLQTTIKELIEQLEKGYGPRPCPQTLAQLLETHLAEAHFFHVEKGRSQHVCEVELFSKLREALGLYMDKEVQFDFSEVFSNFGLKTTRAIPVGKIEEKMRNLIDLLEVKTHFMFFKRS